MGDRIDRRQALALLGTVSLGGVLAACGDEPGEVTTTEAAKRRVAPKSNRPRVTADLFDESASCSLAPEQTEGPYYFDVDSIRSDIREDREGAALQLALRVRGAGSCRPLENAVVDVWHCDALGSYSGFDGGAKRAAYLRGAQVTNADGIVEFKTIYPGWYRGRTVHVHAKVHLDKTTVLTTQLYFDEKASYTVHARPPYSRAGGRDVSNETDDLFDERLLLSLSRDGNGYLGLMTFDIERA